MAAKPKDVDRARLEVEYRAGIKSLRTLGAEFGLSGARVAQIAEEEDWTRDLKARIRAATEAKLNSAILNVKVDSDKVALEDEVVDANANRQVGVVRRQGERIGKLTDIADRMTKELADKLDNAVELEVLGDLLHAPDDKGRDKLNEIYRKVIDFPNRVSALKNLVETSKTLIALERQNVGLADNANGEADSGPKTEMSDSEAARRIAYVFSKAIKNKGVTNDG